jgi:TPR repeat protein
MRRRASASFVLALVAVLLLAPGSLATAAAALPIELAAHWRDGAGSTGANETRRTPQPLGGLILTAADGATATPLSRADVLERIERRLRAVADYPPYLYEVKLLSDAIAVVWMDITSRQRDAYDQSYFAAIDYIEREKLALIRARRLADDGELRAAIDLLGEAERFRKISHAFTEAAQAAFESDIAAGELWVKAAYESSRAAAIFAGAVHGPSGMQAADALFLGTDFFVDWTQLGFEQAAANTFSRAATKLLLTQVTLLPIQADADNLLAASFNRHFAGRTFEAALADGSTTILDAQVAPYIVAALEAPATRERLLALLMGSVEHTLERNLIGPAVDAAFAGYLATLTGQQPAERATASRQATELATQVAAAGLRPTQQALAQEIVEAFDGDIDTIRLVARHADHAWLAAAAYGNERGQPYQQGTSLPLPGWTVADAFLIENTFTGDLSATLFTHEDGRVVLAFRGTVPGSGDKFTNLLTPTSIPTAQIVQAEEIAKSVAIQHPDVVFVGHSLGGRLANNARMTTGRDAVVFSTAPHSARELSMKSAGGRLLAFRSPDDLVSILTAMRDIEVANFHTYDTANFSSRTGAELVVGLRHDHGVDDLAAAMRVVEIALPWIEQALSTAIAEAKPLDLSTAHGLQATCTAGDAESCLDLGNLYANGEGVEKDLARAAELYRQACEAGNGEGCARIAGLYYNGEAVDKDLALAADFYRRGCDAGEGRACAWLGYLYENGQGVQVDLARATDLYGQGCAAADAWSCNQLGNFHRLGRGVEKDLARAASFYQLACQHGNMAGCGSLAILYQTGQGIETDLDRALELFIQACDGKEPVSCNNLGVVYRDGAGVEQDQASATARFEQACDGHNMEGCYNLGMLYRDGKGVEQDQAKAASLFEQACQGAEMRACNNLGVRYRDGRGVEQDQAKAASLFQQACDGKNALGCDNLAALYADGRGVEKKEALAAKLYQQACEGGLARGCFNLGVAHEGGRGVDKDLKRAAALYQQACDGRHADSCTVAGINFQMGIGVEQNFGKAADFFQRACEGGNTQECGALGDLLSEGKGVGQDFARAADLYRRACDGGHAASCNKLGNFYANGQGTQSDAAEAAKYYQQACTGGDLFGCRNLAASYYQGNGVPKDLPRAADLYRQACEKDDASSCSILGMFYQAGMGVEQDIARAAGLFRRACEGGYETACSRQADKPIVEAEAVRAPIESAPVQAIQEARAGTDRCTVTLASGFAGSFKWAGGAELGPNPILEWDGACDGPTGKPIGTGKVTALAANGTKIWYWLVGPNTGFEIFNGQLNWQQVSRSYMDLRCRSPRHFGNGEVTINIDDRTDLAGKIHFRKLLFDGVNYILEKCIDENPGVKDFDVRFSGFPISGMHETGSGLTRTSEDNYKLWNWANPLDRQRERELGSFNQNLLQRIAVAEQQRRQQAQAARKDQLRDELAQRVDGWLSSSGIIDNVADAMQHDRLKTMAQLALGKRIRVTVTPPSFSDGRFVIHNRVSAFNVDQAAGDTGFSWDRWFQATQNFGQGVYTVVCRFTPDQAGSLTEGTSIVVEATLIAAGTNDIVLDCAP